MLTAAVGINPHPSSVVAGFMHPFLSGGAEPIAFELDSMIRVCFSVVRRILPNL
jgi:hypothetical protein